MTNTSWNDVSVTPNNGEHDFVTYLTTIKGLHSYVPVIGEWDSINNRWCNAYIGPAFNRLVVAWMELPKYNPTLR